KSLVDVRISGARMQAENTQRQPRPDLLLCQRRQLSAAGGELQRIGELAGHDDVARAQALVALERQAARGLRVVAQPPVAVDPEAMVLRQRVYERTICGP